MFFYGVCYNADFTHILISPLNMFFQLRDLINKYAGFDLFSKLIKFLKFGTVGFSGVIINLSIFYLSVNQFGLSLNLSAVAAFLIASVNNYFWGHYWAFASPLMEVQLSFTNYLKYLSFSGLGLGINLIVLNTITFLMGIDFYLLAQFMGILTAAFFNFTVFSLFVFKEEKSSGS